MSRLISHGKLVLIDRQLGGFDIEIFDSYHKMIRSLLHSGVIGDGCFGSYEHSRALHEIEDEIKQARIQILESVLDELHRDQEEAYPL